tara:strand:+ start:714 stop:845 length:132 start_codon:yes stop_codon:yes gene_type:complete
MFGIDPYSFETLAPSLIMIAVMTGAMIWGGMKIRSLMDEDKKS